MKTNKGILAVGTLTLAFLWSIVSIAPASARPTHHLKRSHLKRSHKLHHYLKRRHALKHHRYRIAATGPTRRGRQVLKPGKAGIKDTGRL